MKMLIVEDNSSVRKLFEKILLKYGQVDVAVNGYDAIEKFELSINKGSKYDIIFLDIMMLGLDGHKTLKEIRNIENNFDISYENKVKVTMVTALDDVTNVKNALKGGVSSYMVKPINKELIKKELEKLKLI